MTSTTTEQLWFARPLARPDADVRLFCIPHAGSGAAQFHSWAAALPSSIELYAVRLPGRENRRAEPPFRDVVGAAAALGEAIAPLLDRPFAFFGHSMGALIAYELARSVPPDWLFVSGRRAPHVPDREFPIHQLPEGAFVDAMTRRYGVSATSLLHDPELRALFVPVLRADFEAVERYQYRAAPPLDCPITAFGGLTDPRADPEGLHAWRGYTTGEFDMRLFPGDHFFHQTLRDKVVAEIARALVERA